MGSRRATGSTTLRKASNAENQQNLRINRRNTIGLLGVSWDKSTRKWVTQIKVDNRKLHVGLFPTREEAFAAYLAAKAIVHPFSPVPRGITPMYINSSSRLRAVKRIVSLARKHRDTAMEWAAWQHAFLYAC